MASKRKGKKTHFMETPVMKAIMPKLYGWGAAVVILGALFKILHLPGANIMLIVGLGTEALIFFVSAFEPVHEPPDWSLVYPELDPDNEKSIKAAGKKVEKKAVGESPTDRLNKQLEQAKVENETFRRLGEGLKSLSESASQISNISKATVATDAYTKNITKAADTVEKFNSSQSNAINALDTLGKTGSVSGQYAKELQAITQKLQTTSKELDNINNSYSKAVVAVDNMAASDAVTKEYSKQISAITDKLTQLNDVYGKELEGAGKHTDMINTYYSGLTKAVENITSTEQATVQFKSEITKLSQNLSSLNNVYGNILSAMNVKS